MQTEDRPRFYLPELDGLRFIAFLLVFIHNAPSISSSKIWTALHEYGWIGVDLFFCLSGFLITKLLVTEHQLNSGINVRGFYYRRILRIWPLYFLYILIGLVFILSTQGRQAVLPKHLAGLTTFTYDIVYLFLTYKVFVVYFHLWTISYEEQFYAIIPLAIRKLVQNTYQRNWLIVLGIFACGSLIRAAFIYLKVKHPAVYMLPITHFEAMLGGFAIGLGLFDNVSRNVKNWIFLLVGLGIITAVFQLPNTYEIGWSLMLTYTLVGLGMTSIILGIMNGKPSFINKLLRNDFLVYLGKISYGLYIFHLLGISLLNLHYLKISYYLPTLSKELILFFGGLLMTILLSIGSYQILERPFLKLKEKFSFIESRPA